MLFFFHLMILRCCFLIDDLGICLPIYFPRSNLKLHNITLTPKVIKKVSTNLVPLRHLVLIVSGGSESRKGSYTLANIFNMYLKEDCW